jgi:hypothetical protein
MVVRTHRKLRFAGDSPLEGTGFEPLVPLLRKGFSAVAERRCRADKLDGVIKHRSSRETTVVGRGPPLHGRLFDGGTDGSNPSSSSGESYKTRSSRRISMARPSGCHLHQPYCAFVPHRGTAITTRRTTVQRNDDLVLAQIATF